MPSSTTSRYPSSSSTCKTLLGQLVMTKSKTFSITYVHPPQEFTTYVTHAYAHCSAVVKTKQWYIPPFKLNLVYFKVTPYPHWFSREHYLIGQTKIEYSDHSKVTLNLCSVWRKLTRKCQNSHLPPSKLHPQFLLKKVLASSLPHMYSQRFFCHPHQSLTIKPPYLNWSKSH